MPISNKRNRYWERFDENNDDLNNGVEMKDPRGHDSENADLEIGNQIKTE